MGRTLVLLFEGKFGKFFVCSMVSFFIVCVCFVVVEINESQFKILYTRERVFTQLNTNESAVIFIDPPLRVPFDPESISWTQYGVDGAGHQMEGLLSVMNAHGKHGIYIDGHDYLNRERIYEHISAETVKQVGDYFNHGVGKFVEEYEIIEREYQDIVPPKSGMKVFHGSGFSANPSKELLRSRCHNHTLYRIDSFWGGKGEIPEMEDEMLDFMYRAFVSENPHFPESRFTNSTAVFHIRSGDRQDAGNMIRRHLAGLVDVFINGYVNEIWIHSNGGIDPGICGREYVKCFGEDVFILDVLSDFVHADVFVPCFSALSAVPTYFRKNKMNVFVNDGEFIREMVATKRMKNFGNCWMYYPSRTSIEYYSEHTMKNLQFKSEHEFVNRDV